MVQKARRHRLGAVGIKLRQILPGVGMGAGEKGGHAKVQRLPVPGQQPAVIKPAGRGAADGRSCAGHEDRIQDLRRPGAGKAEHGDAAGHGAAAAGGNGIGHKHPSFIMGQLSL